MYCPRCGTKMQGGVCPECGFPVNQMKQNGAESRIERYIMTNYLIKQHWKS